MATDKPVLREDGSVGIPDLVLGRSLETSEDHTAYLVIELKRSNHNLESGDVDQLRSYASAIVNDERFARSNVSWDFWLVGNEAKREVDEMREQTHLPYGVVQSSKKYKIIVRTWAEVIGSARHRLKFVQKSLQYESTRDTSLAYLRSRYSEYLPAEALASKTVGRSDESSAGEIWEVGERPLRRLGQLYNPGSCAQETLADDLSSLPPRGDATCSSGFGLAACVGGDRKNAVQCRTSAVQSAREDAVGTKTRRIEMRADPESEAKIAEAARLSRQSVSSFVLSAATTAAEQVIARVDHLLMPADQFDALLNSLDVPDDAPTLARAASRKRRFTRT